MSAACHCKGCQRMTASAFSLSILVPNAGFSIEEGEPVLGGAQEMDGVQHLCCNHCKSWVFTRFPEVMGEFTNVRSAMLDEPDDIAPFVETFTSEKLPWVTTPAVHSYERFPEPAAYGGLMKEYAER